jgi:hypothetical protein
MKEKNKIILRLGLFVQIMAMLGAFPLLAQPFQSIIRLKEEMKDTVNLDAEWINYVRKTENIIIQWNLVGEVKSWEIEQNNGSTITDSIIIRSSPTVLLKSWSQNNQFLTQDYHGGTWNIQTDGNLMYSQTGFAYTIHDLAGLPIDQYFIKLWAYNETKATNGQSIYSFLGKDARPQMYVHGKFIMNALRQETFQSGYRSQRVLRKQAANIELRGLEVYPGLPLLACYCEEWLIPVEQLRGQKRLPQHACKPLMIGQRNSLRYQKAQQMQEVYPFEAINSCYIEQPPSVLLNDNLSHIIQCYDTTGKLLRTFGQPGKNLGTNDTIAFSPAGIYQYLGGELYVHKSGKYKSARNYSRLQYLLARDYGPLFFDAKTGFCFRLYHTKDTLSIPALTDTLQQNPDAFYERLPRKPTYLQIYDLSDNDRLIFDGPVPAPFKVLDVDKEGYLWAIAGQEEDKLVIRKYKILRE